MNQRKGKKKLSADSSEASSEQRDESKASNSSEAPEDPEKKFNERLNQTSVFPYTTILILVVVAVVRFDLVLDMFSVISTYTGLTFQWSIVLFCGAISGAYGLARLVLFILKNRSDMKIAENEKKRIYEEERNALMAFFVASNGKKWRDKTRWGSEEPYRKWKGVHVDRETERVTKIILAGNQLSGFISPDLRLLRDLNEIDLRDNDIKGSLPEELSQLENLEGLYLHNNFIGGKIPDSLSLLPKLKGIYLFNNCFEDIERTKDLFRENLGEECFIFI